jgi:putative SOS response-associated peptidase YedK
MCNNYASHVPANRITEAFEGAGTRLRFEGGAVPNLEPRDDIRIGDTAPVVTWDGEGPVLRTMTWAWRSPQGRPVFNFRSDGRSFVNSARCLIPADAFYEFTDPEPGQKRKTKWRFTVRDQDWFWIAGIVREAAWAMLTTEPGPDVAPYHDRQIVLGRLDGPALDWLSSGLPVEGFLAPAPPGLLRVEKVFP